MHSSGVDTRRKSCGQCRPLLDHQMIWDSAVRRPLAVPFAAEAHLGRFFWKSGVAVISIVVRVILWFIGADAAVFRRSRRVRTTKATTALWSVQAYSPRNAETLLGCPWGRYFIYSMIYSWGTELGPDLRLSKGHFKLFFMRAEPSKSLPASGHPLARCIHLCRVGFFTHQFL